MSDELLFVAIFPARVDFSQIDKLKFVGHSLGERIETAERYMDNSHLNASDASYLQIGWQT
jgi:hypothetical protein